MNPITHLSTGWVFARIARAPKRERALICAAVVFPDLDGFGLPIDLATRGSAHPTELWTQWHHVLLHGIFGATLMAAIGWALADRRRRTALLCFASVHLHLLEDLVGSGGPHGDRWPINYLGPFSQRLTFD